MPLTWTRTCLAKGLFALGRHYPNSAATLATCDAGVKRKALLAGPRRYLISLTYPPMWNRTSDCRTIDDQENRQRYYGNQTPHIASHEIGDTKDAL